MPFKTKGLAFCNYALNVNTLQWDDKDDIREPLT